MSIYSLTQTLDSLSVNLSRSHNTSQVVQPNLVVQSTQILADDSQGVQFSSLAGWRHKSTSHSEPKSRKENIDFPLNILSLEDSSNKAEIHLKSISDLHVFVSNLFVGVMTFQLRFNQNSTHSRNVREFFSQQTPAEHQHSECGRG